MTCSWRLCTAVVACVSCGDRFLGAAPRRASSARPLRPVVRIDEGLRGDRADAGLDVRNERAHGKEPGGDRDANASGRFVTGDDRPGHSAAPKLGGQRATTAESNAESIVSSMTAMAQRVSAATSPMTVAIGPQADDEWTPSKCRD